MNRVPLSAKLLLAIQLLILLAAFFTLNQWGILRGIAFAQASLLGVALAIAPIHQSLRLWLTILLAVLFISVCATLTFNVDIGQLAGMQLSGWDILMMLARVIVVGGILWQGYYRKRIMLSLDGKPYQHSLFRFSISFFLAVTLLVSLYFAIKGNLDGDFYKTLLVVFYFLYGMAYGAMSLLAVMLALESDFRPKRIAIYLIGILVISVILASKWYDSWDPWARAQYAWLLEIIEVAWIIGSLLVLRFAGYRLASQKSSDMSSATLAESTTQEIVGRRKQLVTSLKVLAAIWVFLSVWLAWNFYIVKQRTYYRQAFAGRGIGIMTVADGNASASKEVKLRIASLLREAKKIKKGGGSYYLPESHSPLSWIRRSLGDEPIYLIVIDSHSQRHAHVFQSYFPEATIAVRPSQEIEESIP